MSERKSFNVSCYKVEQSRRDVSSPILATEEAGYKDILLSDDRDDVPLGFPVAYEAHLTEEQAEQFRAASNARAVEPQVYATLDEVEVVAADADEEAVADAINRGIPGPATLAYMDADGMEAAGWNGAGVKVAVADGGTTQRLKGLMGWNVVDRVNFVHPGSPVHMVHRHGCLVTPEAMPTGAALCEYVVFDSDARGSFADLARAIKRAVDQDVDVFNYSGSARSGSQVVRDAIDYRNRVRPGMVLYASAGNDGEHRLGYPSAYHEFRSSIAYDHRNNRKASFSNYHADAAGVTPGVQCLSYDENSRYIRWSGTSSSSPKKARLVAMGATRGRGNTPQQVAKALNDAAVQTPEGAGKAGHGRYQLRAALNQLAEDKKSPENPVKGGEVLYGIDVSSHQGRVNWRQVAKEGFRFAISKATEGLYYEDKYLKRNLEWSEKRGLIPGAYLFLTNQDVKKQIDKFLAAVGDVDGKLIALDIEDPRWNGVEGRGQPSVTDAWNAVHYLHERIAPHPILIYSGNWYWSGRLGDPDLTSLVDGKDCRLWVSRYVNGSGYASVLNQKVPERWWRGEDGGGFGGEAPTILQFTEHAKIAGKNMDANAFRGTLDELKVLASSAGFTGPEDPEPEGRTLRIERHFKNEEVAGKVLARHEKNGWEAIK